MHLYVCVVHEPHSVKLSATYFKKPPNKVTEENKSFWKEEVEVGVSICKKCYWKFDHRPKGEKGLVDTSSNNSNV